MASGGGEYGEMEDRLRTTHGTSFLNTLQRKSSDDLTQDAAHQKTPQSPQQVSIKDLSNQIIRKFILISKD